MGPAPAAAAPQTSGLHNRGRIRFRLLLRERITSSLGSFGRASSGSPHDGHAPAQHGDSHDGPSLLPVITGRSLKTVTCPGVQTHSPASWARPSARNSLTGLVMAFRGLSLSPWRLSAGPFAGTDGPPCSTQSCLPPTMEAGHQEGV